MIYIAKVYADLIRKEEKNIEDVPESIREQVREILADQEGQDGIITVDSGQVETGIEVEYAIKE